MSELSRLVNGERKISYQKPENVGKILAFCEGATEFNYLNYFKKYLDNNIHAKYSDIVIEPINTEGNAMNVFNYAEKFLSNEENARKYVYYEKHLIFDCDAPENIKTVISLMRQSPNNYFLDYSNLLFETWLVMHFQDLEPNENVNKRQIISQIREILGISRYTSKIKASEGMIGQILGSDGNNNIRAAIKNAKQLEKYWRELELTIDKNAEQMNPSVGIYELVERMLDEVVYLCS